MHRGAAFRQFVLVSGWVDGNKKSSFIFVFKICRTLTLQDYPRRLIFKSTMPYCGICQIVANYRCLRIIWEFLSNLKDPFSDILGSEGGFNGHNSATTQILSCGISRYPYSMPDIASFRLFVLTTVELIPDT